MITAEQAVELLERAVRERGTMWVDPVYAVEHRADFDMDSETSMGCIYFKPPKSDVPKPYRAALWHFGVNDPVCLIGLALSYVGLTADAVKGHQKEVVGMLYQDGLLPEMDKDALIIFSEAQHVQDGGAPWGVALDRARKMLEDMR